MNDVVIIDCVRTPMGRSKAGFTVMSELRLYQRI